MTDPLRQFTTMPATLEATTGRSLAAWQATVRELGLEKHGQIVAALKADHGLSHGYANMLALLHTGYGQAGEDELVTALFDGSRAGLRPIYDRLLEIVGGFGAEVEVAPKKTMVMLRRSRAFACFTPSSAKRAEIGIALRGNEPTERLRASKGMTSHAVWIDDPAAIDDEIIGWLRAAYDRA